MDKVTLVFVLCYMVVVAFGLLVARVMGIDVPGNEICPEQIKGYECKRSKRRPCDHSPEARERAWKDIADARREIAIKTGNEEYLNQ